MRKGAINSCADLKEKDESSPELQQKAGSGSRPDPPQRDIFFYSQASAIPQHPAVVERIRRQKGAKKFLEKFGKHRERGLKDSIYVTYKRRESPESAAKYR